MSDPIVESTDLASYLGVDNINTDRADLILGMAQALCESVVTPLPAGAEAVVLDVAARAFANPTNAQSQTAGPYNASYGAVSGGLWLTNSNRRTLRQLGGGSGAFTIDVTPDGALAGLPWWDVNAAAPGGDWDIPA